MAITVVEGRTLPSVFSDIPSRGALAQAQEDVQRARKKIGELGMQVLVLVGLLVAAIAVAVIAFYLWRGADARATTLDHRVDRIQEDTAAYGSITAARDQVETARAQLLDVLAAPGLGERARTAGWAAALGANSCVALEGRPNELVCFRADSNASPQSNQPSRYWDGILGMTNRILEAELAAVNLATRNAREAQAQANPPTPPPPLQCDTFTGICRRAP